MALTQQINLQIMLTQQIDLQLDLQMALTQQINLQIDLQVVLTQKIHLLPWGPGSRVGGIGVGSITNGRSICDPRSWPSACHLHFQYAVTACTIIIFADRSTARTEL